ncbi:Uncharacterized membrane protein [Halogranum gelatinilyticum]|uniref:Uncharacterized membrane protein n=1 Tax=Halogranum gelatinilyticum TaxID=660521 RepID=A0A1G9U7U8_9EURY|nr:DUF502 domain-containing protein [Halogranum gelatinilyticum]SDM56076.1 Uncharacterized membrane protein [Halogranum gelatinilyticum]
MAKTPAGRGLTGNLRHWLVTGLALTVPLIVTLFILGIALNFLSNALDPTVWLVRYLPGVSPIVEGILIEAVMFLFLLVIILGVGLTADVTETNHAQTFHTAVEAVPGVGELYRSFRRMSDVVLDDETETFQEVKLVEFPHEGSYSLAFVTADTPGTIHDAVGEMDMQTLFVPLAPNPVMGGFLVHFSTEQIYDVDMTVEEAIQALVTSGVSVEVAGRDRDRPMSMDELGEMNMDPVDETFDADDPDRPG